MAQIAISVASSLVLLALMWLFKRGNISRRTMIVCCALLVGVDFTMFEMVSPKGIGTVSAFCGGAFIGGIGSWLYFRGRSG